MRGSVVFGVPSLKIHSKLCLITRHENGEAVRYAHIGTGNFNEKTAKIYTDFSLLTRHPDITAEVALAVQRGVTVVVTSRVPYGEVTATYGGGGGAVDLRRAGAIVSPWLRAPQARMALIALLTSGHDLGLITDLFVAQKD